MQIPGYRAEQIFRSYLAQDERILWAEQPDPNKIFSLIDIYYIPIGIFIGLFMTVWEGLAFYALLVTFLETGEIIHPLIIIFPLVGFPFFLFGLYFMFGRFFYKRWRRKRTFFAVTNKRVLVLSKLRHYNLQELQHNSIAEINLTAKSNGTGKLEIFSNDAEHRSALPGFLYDLPRNLGTDFSFSGIAGQITFYDIKDPHKVYNLIQEAKNRPNL
jgi:hypothetical protein